MIDVSYSPEFIRKFNKLNKDLQEEVYEKILEFKSVNNHKKLKAHKLHGKLKNRYGFSINYKVRIIFKYISRKEIVLITIGDHSIYRKKA